VDYAASGLTGPRLLLEGSRGYFHTVAERFEPKEVVSLGRWHLAAPRRKQHACCGYIHAALDLIAGLRARLGAAQLATAAITVRMPAHIIPAVVKALPPATPNEARFHTQYCAAVAAAEADVILPAHSNEMRHYLDRADIHRLMAAIQVEADESLRHYEECRIGLVLADGSVESVSTRSAKGSPTNPLAPAEMRRKFLLLTADMLPRERAEAYADAVLNLERYPELDWLFSDVATAR
jgi:2-methylcitrate dehydratase PrpD